MIFVNMRKTPKGKVLALCDEELIGKKYKEGKTVLDLDKYRVFYEGEKIDEDREKISALVRDADSINAVGSRSIALLEELGLNISNARTVKGVLHLHVYKI